MPLYNLSSSSAGVNFSDLPNGAYKMKHFPGQWYTMPRGAGSNTGINENNMFFTPVLVTGTLEIDRTALRHNSGNAANDTKNILVGIYSNSDRTAPDQLLHSFTSSAYWNGPNSTTHDPTLTLTQGLYWIGFLNPSGSGFSGNWSGYSGGAIYLPSDELDAQYGPITDNTFPTTYAAFSQGYASLPETINPAHLQKYGIAISVAFRVVNHTV